MAEPIRPETAKVVIAIADLVTDLEIRVLELERLVRRAAIRDLLLGVVALALVVVALVS